MRQHLRTTSQLVLLLASAVSLIAPTATSAVSPEIPDQMAGVWKMSPEKSHWPGSNAPQTLTERIEKQGPRTLRTSFDIGLPDGTKRHEDVVRTFDGQEQPMREQSGLTQT